MRPQPLRLLNLLLERPGEVLTREEIRQELWSAETFVDFEHSLNTAVMVLRGVLNDSAGEPVYIETLPRVGYRFIAEVVVMNEKAATTAEVAAGGEPSKETEAPDLVESEPASTAVPAVVPAELFLRWLRSGDFTGCGCCRWLQLF